MNKKVVDVKPNDRITVTHTLTVVETRLTASTVTLKYDDGTEQTWDLSADPAIEVIDA